MRFINILLTLLPDIITASPISTRQSPKSAAGLSSNATTATTSLFERWNITGEVVAYISPGKSEVLSIGKRDVTGNDVTNQTYFAIASNTKLFTAVAINLLIEDGVKLANGQNLSLGSKMKDIIPDFAMRNSTAGEEVTLLDVMSMHSGLPQHILATTPTDCPLSALSRTPQLTLNTQWGQDAPRFHPFYSTYTTISDFVQKRIFDPLGMGATTNATLAGEKERSQGFFRSAPNITECTEILKSGGSIVDEACVGTPEGFEFWTDEAEGGFYGGAGINLRGVDMVKWAQELLKPTVIPQSALTRIQTAVPAPNTDKPLNTSELVEVVAYQTGTVSQWYRGHKFYLHDGALPGSNSYFAWSPETGIAVFVAANDDAVSIYSNEVVVNTVLDDLLGVEAYDWEKEVLERLTGGTGGIEGSTGGVMPGDTANTTSTPRPPPTGYANSTFTDSAYGNFTLLPLNLSSPASFLSAGIPSEYFAGAIAPALSLNVFTSAYYATYKHSIVTHLVFTHFDGPLYNYTTLFVKPRLDAQGVNGLTAKTYGLGPAVLAEDGIGMFGNFRLQAASLPMPEVLETGLKDKAPVFFVRA